MRVCVCVCMVYVWSVAALTVPTIEHKIFGFNINVWLPKRGLPLKRCSPIH